MMSQILFLYRRVRLLSAILVSVAVFSFTAAPAQAQIATPAASTILSVKSISSAEEMQTLKDQYKTDLSVYRTDERSYELAKAQFNQLGTLVSLEEAVKATRTVLLSRSTVLLTYVKIIKLFAQDTPGISAEEKNSISTHLTMVELRIQKHQEVVRQAIDRKLIQVAVDDYRSFENNVPQAVYQALSYEAYGRIHVVYDTTTALRDEIKQHIQDQEKNGLKLGEKQRAFVEIDKNLDQTGQRLESIHKTFTSVDQNQQAHVYTSGTYNQAITDLGQVYADLFSTLGFLREVLKS